MWSAVAALAFAVGALTWTNEPQLASDAGDPGGPPGSTLPTLPLVVRIPLEDELATHRIAQLMEQSATAREMLEILRRSRHLFVSLRSRPKLWQFTGVNGRSTVHVAGERVFASLEFDSRGCVARQLRAIAHELAHTVEIASMEEIHSTAALRSRHRGVGWGCAENRTFKAVATPQTALTVS